MAPRAESGFLWGAPRPWAMGLLVFALVLSCYWPARNGGLVWDDAAHVTRPELRSWAGLGRIWTDLHATQQYYPVLHSAFWLEHRLWGDRPLGYHLTNMLLHATACCLLALVLGRLWRDPARAASPAGAGTAHRAASAPRWTVPRGAAWIAAGLFAVHPVCVESVAWISEQKNTLSLGFYLLAALAYLRFDTTRRAGAYAAATGFFLLALGTKTVTATLPAALLVMFWWKRGALRWRTDVIPLLPWLAAALAAGVLTAWVERTLIGAAGGTFELRPAGRMLLAGRVIWFYLGKLAWPAHLSFVYPRWDVAADASGWSGWLAATLAVTLALWLLRRRTRGPLATWLFFTGSLFPALGFFNVYPFQFSYVADHFQYLASIAMIAGFAALVGAAAGRLPPPARRFALLAIAIMAAILGVISRRQSGEYRDSETLYRATLAKNPECWMAHSNLGAELAATPARIPEALAHYAEALRLKPDCAEAHNNLGLTLSRLPGRLPDAISHYRAALAIMPGFLGARLNLANALAEIPGRANDALAEYAEAVRLKPDFADAHFSLANLLARLPGRTPEAIAEYERALELRPDYAEAHENLAGVLVGDPARLQEALAHYDAALRITPGRASTHYNRAIALERLPGQGDAALAEFEVALRLDPTHVGAHNNLGILFAQRGDLRRARAHWEAALRLRPDFEDARHNLELLDRESAR